MFINGIKKQNKRVRDFINSDTEEIEEFTFLPAKSHTAIPLNFYSNSL